MIDKEENINYISKAIEKHIDLDENSYLYLLIANYGFTVFINVNCKFQTAFTGKTLRLHHLKAIFEERTDSYFLDIKDGHNETPSSLHLDKKTYTTIRNCLIENDIKSTWDFDWDFEEFIYKIQEKTEKEDQ